MNYGSFKELTRIKIIKAKNSKYDGYQKGFPSMLYTFFDKKLQLRVQINLLIVALKIIFQTKNWLKNYTNQLSETLGKEKYNQIL